MSELLISPLIDCCATDPCCSQTCADPGPPGVPGEKGDSGVNGTDGVNAFTTVTDEFLAPDVDDEVDVTVEDNRWMVEGQIIFIEFAGYYEVFDVDPDGVTVTVTNLGYPGNAALNTPIPALSQISPGGLQGPQGDTGVQGDPGSNGSPGDPGSNAFTVTTVDYTQPNVGADVLVTVEDNQWMGIGETLYVVNGGWYTVISFAGTTQVQLRNLGYPGSAAPAASISQPTQVTPSGIRGATGATGSAAASPFQADKDGTDQTNIAVGDQITFSNEPFDPDGVFASSVFTANADGYWRIAMTARLFNATAGTVAFAFYLNGGPGSGGTIVASIGMNTDDFPVGLQIDKMFLLSTSDTIQVHLLNSGGGASCDISGEIHYTWIEGFLVMAT